MLRTIFLSLLLFLASWSGLMANNPVGPKTVVEPTSNPPCNVAPAPTDLHVTNVTSHSISVAWKPTPYGYYKMDVTDLTIGYTYPSEYGYGNQATKSNLPSDHYFSIGISLAADPDCPYGTSGVVQEHTGIIIVELIMGRNCDPQGQGSTSVSVDPGNPVPFTLDEYDPQTNPVIFAGQYVYDIDGRESAYPAYTLNFTMRYDAVSGTKHLNIGKNTEMASTPSNSAYSLVVSNNLWENTATYVLGSPNFEIIKVNIENYDDASANFSLNFNYSGTLNMCPDGGAKLREGSSPKASSGSARIAPNPFHNTVQFQYELLEESKVQVDLFNAQGVLARSVIGSEIQDSGQHTATFDGRDLPTGIYFLVLQMNGERKVHTLVKQ